MLKEIIARIEKKASLIKNHKALIHYRSDGNTSIT